jgi:CRP/FNR family transcriptional regulator, cyclic AMP receptor protein
LLPCELGPLTVTSLLQVYRAVFSSGWFEALSETVQNEVMARTQPRVLESGQRLYSRDDRPDGMFCIVEGCISVSGTSRGGIDTLLDFYGPGVWFGEVATLANTPRMLHDAEAYGPATLQHLSSLNLEELLSTHPSLSRSLLQLQARRMQILFAALQSYSSQTLEQRLATRLLMLASTHGVSTPQGHKIDLHLPQETLARLIGSTRQRVNQILKDWEPRDMVKHDYGRIFLLDQAKLEKLSIT